MSDHPFDPGLQPERTRLAWQRTAISIAVGALVYARIEAGVLGLASWACAVIGAVTGIGIGYWSKQRYRYTHRSLNAGRVALPDGLLPLAVAVVVFAAGVLAVVVALLRATGDNPPI